MAQYLTRGFLLTLIIAFTLLIVMLTLTANNTYQTATMEEANQTLQQIQTERETMTAEGIFINNLLISLPMIVPAVGLIPFLIAWANTGTVIGLLAKATGIPPTTYVLNLTILAFPEILSYSLLIAENIYLSALILTKTGAKARLKTQSWKTILFYIISLFIGAITEAAMIAS
jgi:uncharacterized membrane protein SpoIIM required for sporulation